MLKRPSLCGKSRYQIIVQGLLADAWQADFVEYHITPDIRLGTTTFTAEIRDQTQLISLIIRLNGLGLPLVSVQWLPN